MGTFIRLRRQLADIVIDPRGKMTMGRHESRFLSSDTQSLLRCYLKLLSKARDAGPTQPYEVRRADIEALAMYMRVSAAAVLDQLGLMMGADEWERSELQKLLRVGSTRISLELLMDIRPTG